MRKALVVAASEFQTAVRSKAFIITLVAMPVIMIGSIAAQKLLQDRVDDTPRRFAVIDHSGAVYDELAAATEARNALMAGKAGPFHPERVELGERSLDEVRLELSDRIRREELFAFVEIPADVLEAGDAPAQLSYSSAEPTYLALLQWVQAGTSEIVRTKRLRAIGADAAEIARLTQPVGAEMLGLWTRGPGGAIEQARPVDKVRTFVVPLVLMMVVFIVVMTAAPMLLNSVLEEKMSRISEVLLGSVTPFELMLGKLLGSVGVAMLLGTIYVTGGLVVAARFGYAGVVPLELVPWLIVFVALAVCFYGSLYIAIGAAVSELKDAQSLMMPVIVVTMLPVMAWTAVLQAPNSGFSVGISLFPPATPFLMLLRMALQPPPPLWQAALGLALTALMTVACVWGAGKIFRVGVLSQGKSAGFAQMIRWVLAR